MKGKVFIPLTQNQVTVIDLEDYELVRKYKWSAAKYKNSFYAVNSTYISKTKKCNIKLHRLIMNFPKNMMIDHIDGNGLNNCKSNLRVCTAQQNTWNLKRINLDRSLYLFPNNKWQVKIRINGKMTHLGMFSTKEEAREIRNKNIIKHRGKEFLPKTGEKI